MSADNHDGAAVDQDMILTLRRKLNLVEKEKLDIIVAHNEEVSGLVSDVTRLKLQIEKSEAAKESLEYDLSVVNRELAACRNQLTTAREQSATELNSLRSRIEDQNNEINKWKEEYETILRDKRLESDKFNEDINKKTGEITDFSAELIASRDQQNKLNESIAQKKELIQNMDATIKELKAMKQSNELMIQKISSLKEELEEVRGKESRQNKELYQALDRIRELEESFEREKSLYMESKFTSDIIDLRIKDLENALTKEKESKMETLKKLELTAEHVKEIESSCEAERKSSVLTQEKLNRSEDQVSMLNKRLVMESEQNKKSVLLLNDQIDKQKKDLDNLHTELSMMTKKKAALQDALSAAFKEIKSLLPAKDAEAVTSLDYEAASTKNFAAIIEVLKNFVNSDKQKREKILADIFNLRTQIKKQTATIKDLKRRLTIRDKSIKETDKKAEVMEVWKVKCEKEQEENNQLREEIQRFENHVTNDKSMLQQLRTQVEKLSSNRQADRQTFVTFLSLLHQQLLVVQGHTPDTAHAGSASLHNDEESWNDLAIMVNEEFAQVMSQIKESKGKTLAGSESECMDMDTKCRQLVSECLLVRSQLKQSRGECTALLAASSLLAGCIIDEKNKALHHSLLQKLLVIQTRRFDELKCRIVDLVFDMTLDEEQKSSVRKRSGVLRFRVIVVCVLAARRLEHLGRNQQCRMLCYPSVGKSTSEVRSEKQEKLEQACDWLNSSHLKSILLSTTADLRVVLSGKQKKDIDNRSMSDNRRGLIYLMNRCRTDLVNEISHLTSPFVKPDRDSPHKSLLAHLSTGLDALLQRMTDQQTLFQANSEQVMRALELRVLDFSRRLRHSELERNQLIVDVQKFQNSSEVELKTIKSSAETEFTTGSSNVDVLESSLLKSHLERKCLDAENALRNAEKDREILESYSLSTCIILKQCCPDADITSADTVWSLAQVRLHNSQKIHAGTCFKVVRSLIDQFLDVVQLLMNELTRRRTLSENLAHKVSELKTELAESYQKQLDVLNKELLLTETEESGCVLSAEQGKKSSQQTESFKRIDFRPLVEDLSESLCKLECRLSAVSGSHAAARRSVSARPRTRGSKTSVLLSRGRLDSKPNRK